MFGFLKRNEQRIAQAKRDAAEAEHRREQAEARWPEIRQQSSWADDAHVDALTKRFIQSLHGGNA